MMIIDDDDDDDLLSILTILNLFILCKSLLPRFKVAMGSTNKQWDEPAVLAAGERGY